MYSKGLSCSHVYGCINIVVSKLWLLVARVGWAQFGSASMSLIILQQGWGKWSVVGI